MMADELPEGWVDTTIRCPYCNSEDCKQCECMHGQWGELIEEQENSPEEERRQRRRIKDKLARGRMTKW